MFYAILSLVIISFMHCANRASVQTSCRVVFTIHQEDRRVRGSRPYIDIGISVLRVVGATAMHPPFIYLLIVVSNDR